MFHITMPELGKRRLVLTTALAYANGPLHIGHMTEAILACAFARYRRFCGQEVNFLGADDAHGTAIEIAAESLGFSPERYIDGIRQDHIASYAAYDISYDAYHSTHSDENRRLALEVFDHLEAGGHLVEREVRQLYDLSRGRTLEDRRVRGTCPKCGKVDQPGDSCDNCGATYDATQLINPVSTLSGETPVTINAQHLFLRLDHFGDDIKQWLATGPLQPAMHAKVLEWIDGELRDWCVTRTGPYFGFAVPRRKDLFLYVWVDAPIGYIAALQHFLDRHGAGRDARAVWNDIDTEKVHVIGKDIINFHAILWPGLLTAAALALPDRIHAHGFVNVAGHKMSKSRGNFVLARELAGKVDSDALRWALASRLGAGTVDIDLEAEAVADRINADLVGKVANIPLRLRPFLAGMGGRLAPSLGDCVAYQRTLDQAGLILDAYEALNLAEAARGITAMADDINRDIAEAAPWKIDDDKLRSTVVTDALARFRVLAALLQPVCPRLGARALAIFGEQTLPWAELVAPPLGRPVAIPERLYERIAVADLAVLGFKVVPHPAVEA